MENGRHIFVVATLIWFCFICRSESSPDLDICIINTHSREYIRELMRKQSYLKYLYTKDKPWHSRAVKVYPTFISIASMTYIDIYDYYEKHIPNLHSKTTETWYVTPKKAYASSNWKHEDLFPLTSQKLCNDGYNDYYFNVPNNVELYVSKVFGINYNIPELDIQNEFFCNIWYDDYDVK